MEIAGMDLGDLIVKGIALVVLLLLTGMLLHYYMRIIFRAYYDSRLDYMKAFTSLQRDRLKGATPHEQI